MPIRVDQAGFDALANYVLGRARRAPEQMANYARIIAPIRTGALATSIHVEQTGRGKWAVVANPRGPDGRSYAVYPEMGTRYQLPQPYLRPAVLRPVTF